MTAAPHRSTPTRPAHRRRPLVLILTMGATLTLLSGACGSSADRSGRADATDATAGTASSDPSTSAPVTTPSTTAAPTTTTVASTPATGTLRLPGGRLVPVRAQQGDGRWVVGTPCGTEAVVPAAGTWVQGVRVVLDPGHGGPETGTIGPNGLHESALNLDVAERVAARLAEQGVTVELTRDDDQQVVIAARAELVASLAPELVVSIHHNGGALGSSERPGTLVFHQADSASSRRLAGLLHEEVSGHLAPFDVAWTVGQAPGALAVRNAEGTDFYGMLRRTVGVPTVLLESLYLSSGAEAVALERDDVRQAEAEAVVAGVLRYLTTTDPGSGFRAGLTFGAGSVPTREPTSCVDPPLG